VIACVVQVKPLDGNRWSESLGSHSQRIGLLNPHRLMSRTARITAEAMLGAASSKSGTSRFKWKFGYSRWAKDLAFSKGAGLRDFKCPVYIEILILNGIALPNLRILFLCIHPVPKAFKSLAVFCPCRIHRKCKHYPLIP
jgi:hypothetical protein